LRLLKAFESVNPFRDEESFTAQSDDRFEQMLGSQKTFLDTLSPHHFHAHLVAIFHPLQIDTPRSSISSLLLSFKMIPARLAQPPATP